MNARAGISHVKAYANQEHLLCTTWITLPMIHSKTVRYQELVTGCRVVTLCPTVMGGGENLHGTAPMWRREFADPMAQPVQQAQGGYRG